MGFNGFEPFQKLVHNITLDVMGYEAIWTPSDASAPQQKGRVHFKQNSVKMRTFENVYYSVMEYYIEYYQGVFNGLYELVGANSTREKIDILLGDTWRSFYAEPAGAIWDGKTFTVRMHTANDTHPNAHGDNWL